jgi:cation transport ATPase
MATYEWTGIAIYVAIYGIPFGAGVCVSSWPKAMLLALASFTALYVSIWSVLGPLFLPFVEQLITYFELSALLFLSFVTGALQVAVAASAGFAIKKLSQWGTQRLAAQSASGAA